MSEEYREKESWEQEITSWYVPQRIQPQEVKEIYVGCAIKRPAEAPLQRRSRHGLPIFLACTALLAVLILVGCLVVKLPAPSAEGLAPEGNASSIVDIFAEEDTAIPRAMPDGSVRLILSDEAAAITPQEIYDRVYPATTVVLAQYDGGFSVGTGVIMSEDGYVITNAHVIAGRNSASVLLFGTYLYDALLVGWDTDMDIAVLKLSEAQDLPTAEFGNSDICRVGDTVYAIGNPLGIELQGTFTDGMLSAINRSVQVDGRSITTMQTTAALNNGNSGGPLINEAGQVIGINTLKMGASKATTASVEGLGFALPISDVLFVVNDILAYGEYRGAPVFGMTVADSDEGVIVMSVENGGGAFNAALEPYDVILSVDGVNIETVAQLQALRREHKVGDVVNVVYARGDEQFRVEVTLYSSKR